MVKTSKDKKDAVPLPSLLVFMRHGLAKDRESFEGPDAMRPLTKKGRKRSTLIADRLVQEWPPDAVISSQLLRARETAAFVANSPYLPQALPIVETEALSPEGSVEAWLGFFTAWQAQRGAGGIVWVVGHETQISQLFAAHLGHEPNAYTFKKSGVGVIAPTSPRSGQLLAFLPPRLLLQQG